jgi:hypothetical protein
MEEMREITRKKGLNNLHRCYLMEADLLSCQKTTVSNVKDEFDKAIVAAEKAGFMQDAALGNELAGEFCLRTGDDFRSRAYFTNAQKLYKKWGADALVDHLRQLRGDYIDDRKTSRSSLRPSEDGDVLSNVQSLDRVFGGETRPLPTVNDFDAVTRMSGLTTAPSRN